MTDTSMQNEPDDLQADERRMLEASLASLSSREREVLSRFLADDASETALVDADEREEMQRSLRRVLDRIEPLLGFSLPTRDGSEVERDVIDISAWREAHAPPPLRAVAGTEPLSRMVGAPLPDPGEQVLWVSPTGDRSIAFTPADGPYLRHHVAPRAVPEMLKVGTRAIRLSPLDAAGCQRVLDVPVGDLVRAMKDTWSK